MYPLLFIASLLFITSCSNFETKDELNLDKNSKQIIFFSNEKEYEQEAPYYDAIIELKKDFPDEIKNMKIITPDIAKKYFEAFDVKGSPAILLLHQDKVVVKINGDISSEQIIRPFADALNNELSTSH
ncbi:small peptidoglycan-associated lipoprotein [Bacillus sp. S/N-304-OC-R1]|uniref:small peptidoglycan-associated lipoprotein n=1 Tax=Bacillus sp. S/N-304-OC-R1 TaxID=2758034 RepID=UPI0028BEC0F4|nr:small peptidoglycan-associated lipoprotein [Bacillus sp. S/N-304-OC-R1]